jgi:hypothetical protein
MQPRLIFASSAPRIANILLVAFALLALIGCGGGGGGSAAPDTSAPPTFSIGGNVSGLSGTLVLQNNGGNDLTVNSNGRFTFSRELFSGADFLVTIATQPVGQERDIQNGSGVVNNANVSGIEIACVSLFTVGGSISGLTGSVVLQNNGGDDLPVNSNGGFVFSQPLQNGAEFLVTVVAQPAGQECEIQNGSGVVDNADVSGVEIVCSSLFSVGGVVSGLNGQVTLQNGPPDVVYDWEGPCDSGCVGTATVIITLTDAYVPGSVVTQFDAELFVSLEYSSSSGSFTITRDTLDSTSALFTIDPDIGTDNQVTDGSNTWFIDADRVGGGQEWLAVFNGSVDRGPGPGSAGLFTLRPGNPDPVPVSEDLTLSADGSFEFPTPLADGSGYFVSVLQQPEGQECSVTGGAGSLNGANVTSVQVDCAIAPPQLTLSSGAVKTLTFNWLEISGAIEYRFFERLTDSADFDLIATLAAGADTINLEAFLPDKADASYLLQACDANECTDSSIVSAQTSLTSAIGYFKASNAGVADRFGGSSAATDVLQGHGVAISADGLTMVVGAPGEDSGATGINGDQVDESQPESGAVYVFTKSGAGSWQQSDYIKASNTGSGDRFGSDVAVSADGRTLVVSAPGEASDATGIDGDQSSDAKPGSGAAYVFFKDAAGAWAQTAYLKASNLDPGNFLFDNLTDSFGSSLALSADGNTLAVGAPGINDRIEEPGFIFLLADTGRVYVYNRDLAGNWSEAGSIRSFFQQDEAGTSVDLSADGSVLAIGHARDDNSSAGVNGPCCDTSLPASGAVRIHSRDASGAWSEEAYIKASNPGNLDRFGTSVALSHDGATLAVGAIGEGSGATGIDGEQLDDSLPNSGAVYIFDRVNASWTQSAFVKPSNTTLSQTFGRDVALTGDGTRLVVGSPLEISNATGIDGDDTNRSASGAGAVYLFEADSAVGWSQIRYIKASNTDVLTGSNDNFGVALDISDDGSTLAVGASGEDSSSAGIGGDQGNNNAPDSGAVYLY